MFGMNSYFRLIISQTGTAIEIVPPTNGGAPVDINEVAAYMQQKRMKDFDIAAVYKAIQTLGQEPVTVPVCDTVMFAENETCFLRVSDDKMQVIARFFPASNLGKPMSKNEIVSELSMHRVKVGIDEAAIDKYIANPVYCTDVVLANGKPPRHGSDAKIEYYFNTSLQAKPTKNEDGSVDFFNLNTINHCVQGDLLAKLFPEDRGDYGYTVFGDRLKPRDVKHLTLKYGHNIDISPDKCELHSMINGHVMLTGGKVFVSDVYEVENVGTATGNITSEGSVIVGGNVLSGFSIKATGNVEVKGVVEGATIEAGGDIILERGVNGMGRAKLKAGGKIIAKYVENAELEAGDYVEADSIMHSKVNAKTYVAVDGKKGFISGGIVRATIKVSCKTLGSEMGSDTTVEVGADPMMKARYAELQKMNFEIAKKLGVITTTLQGALAKMQGGAKLSPEQMQYVQSLSLAKQQLEEQILSNDDEYDELTELLNENEDACVEVRSVAFAGTKIACGDASVTLKNNMQYVRFRKVGAEIKASGL